MPRGCSSRIRSIRSRSPPYGKTVAAACELFERSTRRYSRPEWRHRLRRWSAASACRCSIKTVWERPFCRLVHFERDFEHPPQRPQPRLLIVAPMSGHYATLLRGTVEAFLPNHDVYVTDWVGCAHGAAGGRPLRSRRLHRLRDLDPARARRRHPCRRGVPAVGAGSSPRSRSWRRTTILTCRFPWS